MYIDLSTNLLKHVNIAPPRKLNASHGTQVAKYRAKLATILTKTGIQQTISTLTHRHQLNRWNKQQTKRLEHIDREITTAMLQAEITSRPAHTAHGCQQSKRRMRQYKPSIRNSDGWCPTRDITRIPHRTITLFSATYGQEE